jgi:hypothetical protein
VKILYIYGLFLQIRIMTVLNFKTNVSFALYRVIKTSLCTWLQYKNMWKYFKQLQSLTMITHLKLGITDGVSVSMSINVWRLVGDTLNITRYFLYCNHQVHRDFLITLYNHLRKENFRKYTI